MPGRWPPSRVGASPRGIGRPIPRDESWTTAVRSAGCVRCLVSVRARRRGAAAERLDAWAHRRPWLGDLLLAGILAGLVGPGSVDGVRDGGLDSTWTVALWVLIGALHAGVAFCRRAPAPAFLVLAAAELGLALAPFLRGPDGTSYPAGLLPSSLAYLVGVYTVSARGRGWWPTASLVLSLVGALLVTVRVASRARRDDHLGFRGSPRAAPDLQRAVRSRAGGLGTGPVPPAAG
jgi:hypothetical protein